MSSSHALQLGSLHLDLTPEVEIPLPNDRWSNLDLVILGFDIWAEEEKEMIETLQFMLDDEGLGFSATFSRRADRVVMRASLVPSDAPGSMWKRVKRSNRMRHLKRLFGRLRKGPDGDGDWLMGRTVCDTVELDLMGDEVLIMEQADDDQNMADIYASIPSPCEPSFPSTLMIADNEIYRRLEEYENPEGVTTSLYQYQHASLNFRMSTKGSQGVEIPR